MGELDPAPSLVDGGFGGSDPGEDPDQPVDAGEVVPDADAGVVDPPLDETDAGVVEPPPDEPDAGPVDPPPVDPPPVDPPPVDPPPPGPQCTTEVCNGLDDDCDGQFDEGCNCPSGGPVSGLGENDPLSRIDASGFALRDDGRWSANAALIDGWSIAKVGIRGVIASGLNRRGSKLTSANKPSVPNYRTGFAWESGDMNVDYWVPQGLAGSTVDSHKMVAVSWHYDNCSRSDPNPAPGGEKGARVSFAEVTDMNNVLYRHVLLVEPGASGFKEVAIHAGGIAWAGNYLYVADTSGGLRVFDVDRIAQADSHSSCSDRIGSASGRWCAFGYSYVLPQVASYRWPANTSRSCRPLSSTLGIDWTTSPPSFLVGEYVNDSVYGRLVRWPLDPSSWRLAGGEATRASEAFYMGDRNIQGACSTNGRYWLSATRHCGALFAKGTSGSVIVKKFSSNTWAGMAEGVYRSGSGNLWTVTEGSFNRGGSCKPATCASSPRIVFAVNPAP